MADLILKGIYLFMLICQACTNTVHQAEITKPITEMRLEAHGPVADNRF